MHAGCERGVLSAKRTSIYLFMCFLGMLPAAAGVCSTVECVFGWAEVVPPADGARMDGTTPEACGAKVLSARSCSAVLLGLSLDGHLIQP